MVISGHASEVARFRQRAPVHLWVFWESAEPQWTVANSWVNRARKALEVLEGKALVTLVRLTDRYAAHLTPQGDLALSQRRSFPDGPKRNEDKPRPVKVVPKGLRSFDEHDADFFLELLPDPRHADGLPESIHFWKTRIEETAPDRTFAVGVIYGPSGCGKSSLVKAGLLPRLSESVLPVYLEATADDTEVRLLKGLGRHFPDLHADLGLRDTLSALRAGTGSSATNKVLIVLDQFEQWLHTKRSEEGTELTLALGQCDGERLQALLMVRDDFWMALTRFMGEMGIALKQWENFAAVDLFDLRHARKVLTAFGQAFGTLPDRLEDLTRGEKEFLDQAVNGLARDGRIISVRLALFAEMAKGKPWTPATLREVGGMEGIGVTFLEEAFGSIALKAHQKSAEHVLKALLPESGTSIKGHMRSHEELMEAAGYAARPKAFGDLLHILDSETRLITPIDPEGIDTEGEERHDPEGKFYRLTHDYLVPSLREWLTRKQKEIRRGRAELLLAELASLWHAKPENRRLPSPLEWANIRLLTRKKDWNESQRRMMRKAGWVHGSRTLAALVLLGLLTWGGIEGYGTLRALSQVESLWTASTTDVPALVQQLDGYRRWAKPVLEAELARKPAPDATVDAQDQLAQRQARAAVALLRWGQGEKVWNLLRHSPDPRLRSFIVNWLAPLGVDSRTIAYELAQIDQNAKPMITQGQQAMDAILFHPETSMRRALILVLGQFGEERLSAEDRKPLIDNLLALYQNDPDAGIHGVAEWTLRKWGQQESLKEKDAAMRGKEPNTAGT